MLRQGARPLTKGIQMDNDKTAIQATGKEPREESMRVNLSEYRTLNIAFINSQSQERVRLEFRHDADGAVMEVWIRDEHGRNHTYVNACFLG
jgi:hypothetical protein